LQYLARITIQYDLADLAALLLTPSIITLFVWRDGWFTLEGTGILVRPCDLDNLWIRFAILLCVKPAASLIARSWLRAKMRKTLLGKRTMHGTSQLAARIIASRKIVAKDKDGNEVGSDVQLQREFNLVEEHLAAVREDLSLSGLDFNLLVRKQLRKWKFYAAVMFIQCFAAFPVRRHRPFDFKSGFDEKINILKDIHNTTPAYRATRAALAASIDASLVALSKDAVWYYVAPVLVGQYDVELRQKFVDFIATNSTCSGGADKVEGWPARMP